MTNLLSWPVFVMLVLATQIRGADMKENDAGSGDDLNITVAVATTGPSLPPTTQPSIPEPTLSPTHSLTTRRRRTITSTTVVSSTMTVATTVNPSSNSPSISPSNSPSNSPSSSPSGTPSGAPNSAPSAAPFPSSHPPSTGSTTSPSPAKTQAVSSDGANLFLEFASLPLRFARNVDFPIQIQLHSDRIVSVFAKVVPTNKTLFREQNPDVPTQLWFNKFNVRANNQPMLINLTVNLGDFVCDDPCDVTLSAGITLTKGYSWNDVVYQQVRQIAMVRQHSTKRHSTQRPTQPRTIARSTVSVTLPTPNHSLMCLGVGASCQLSYQCCSHFCKLDESNAYNKSCTQTTPTTHAIPTTHALRTVRTTHFVPTTATSAVSTTASLSSTSTTETMTCTDYPQWRDNQNHSCEIYLTLNWCSINGNPASGWLGTSGQYAWVSNSTSGYPAAQACCSCGGGSWEASNLDTSNVDVIPMEVDVTNSHFAWGIVIVLSLVGIAGFIWRSRVKAKSTPRYHSLLTDKLSVDNDSSDYDLPTSVSLGDHYAMEETVVFQRTLDMNADVTTY